MVLVRRVIFSKENFKSFRNWSYLCTLVIPCWESVKCKQWKNNNIQVATARKMSKCQLSMKCLLHQTNLATGVVNCTIEDFSQIICIINQTLSVHHENKTKHAVESNAASNQLAQLTQSFYHQKSPKSCPRGFWMPPGLKSLQLVNPSLEYNMI